MYQRVTTVWWLWLPVFFLLGASGLLLRAANSERAVPPGYERRWLEGTPCEPPCWEGITPGTTTLTDAVRLLKENPGIQPQSVVFESFGEPEERRGDIEWDWRGGETGGSIYYDHSQGEAIVTDIWPSLDSIYDADSAVRLGDVIRAYGEPSHIRATGFYGMHGDGPFYTATFYYEKRGMVLESEYAHNGKPRLGPALPLELVTISIEPVRPLRSTFAGHPDDPSTGPQPWRGYQDFDVYCRNTSIGAEPGDPCPEEQFAPASVIILAAVGGTVILSLLGLRALVRRRISARRAH